MEEPQPSVIVYSTPACPWCNRIKQFLKENSVPFISKNVAEDDEALKEMMGKADGHMGVPVTDIKGTIIIGFDEAKFKQALGLNS